MEIEEIKDLITTLEEGKLKKIMIKRGDFELHLEKGDHYLPKELKTAPTLPEREVKEEKDSPSLKKISIEDGNFVISPMVGTFFASPSPEQSPFIKVGDSIDEDTVVCIIEAMKVMNEVKSGVKGTVAEILIDDTQPVEFGSKMFRVV